MGAGPVTAQSAHLVVLGNEKGGSGKSTTAMHLIVALLKAGHRVASIDTDSRQLSLTRYIENRARFARENRLELEIPAHYVARLAAGDTIRGIEAEEFANYVDIIDRVEAEYDYVVVDTPANDSYLMRLSHAMADTLITPVNDSLIDIDLFGQIAPDGVKPQRTGHYAELVRTARHQRHQVDGVHMDWIVVRNRLSMLASRNQRHLLTTLQKLAPFLDFRLASGISERVVFRQFFSTGLTALDRLDKKTQGVEPTMSHLAARQEVRDLVAMLGPPRHRPAERAALVPAVLPRRGSRLVSVSE